LAKGAAGKEQRPEARFFCAQCMYLNAFYPAGTGKQWKPIKQGNNIIRFVLRERVLPVAWR